MRANIVGGPSIVFHRYHEKDITKIQRVHYDVSSKAWSYDEFGNTVKRIVGFDANALYLYCIGQYQLCGVLQYVDDIPNDLIQNILNDQFWGLVEVDIEVPEHLYDYFSIMPPIFINQTYCSSL